MKASERLADRNDLLLIITQCDDQLTGISKGEKTLRTAQLARDILEQRAALVLELRLLGFSAPPLAEMEDVDCGGTLARRRIGPIQEVEHV